MYPGGVGVVRGYLIVRIFTLAAAGLNSIHG